ncbi:MAG: T9SS type A sorting domain-containing protein [Bacteroidia bacterium]|nr:T9SS type A sorting domain-containing protein [Bacteroidia bacterium]MDW8159087.1 T9SS type A sorting domain-containing protein [Bacteroidia bacterium]
MIRYINTFCFTLIWLYFPIHILRAQRAFEANDSVTLGAGYIDDVYYSLEKGFKKSVKRGDWDIAFMVNPSSSILVNTAEQRMLYKLPYAVNQWKQVDTTGHIRNQNRLVNSSKSWYNGAFNRTASGASNDIGWAVYDIFTHSLKGDSLYAISLPGKVWKKLMIEGREQGIYTFRFANLDGSEEMLRSVNVREYQNQLFIYFSILRNEFLPPDREPLPKEWDLLFTKYMHEYENVPIQEETRFYPVTGALLNPSLQGAKVITTTPKNAKWQEANFTPQADIVGFDWKTFNNQTMQWQLDYNRVYFVKDHNNSVWRLYFTDFTGSRSGKILFYKDKVGEITSNDENLDKTITYSQLYPSPARELTYWIFESLYPLREAELEIYNSSGRKMQSYTFSAMPGLNQLPIDTSNLTSGIYYVVLKSDTFSLSQKLVVIE